MPANNLISEEVGSGWGSTEWENVSYCQKVEAVN